jgi:hypothetical protein
VNTHQQPDEREHASATRSRASDPAGNTAAAVPSPDILLALQRKIGNTAVARMLGDPAATQRSAVHEVLRSPGRPLDEPIRDEMTARLGADFSDVRLHTGSDARRRPPR